MLFDRQPCVCVDALPDTGTSRSIINLETFRRLKCELNKRERQHCTTANGTTLYIAGSAKIRLSFEGQTVVINCLVAEDLHEEMLISWRDLQRMGIIDDNFPSRMEKNTSFTVKPSKSILQNTAVNEALTLEGLMDEFSDVFDDTKLTPIKGEPMSIILDRTTKGYRPLRVATARKTPLHLEKAAKTTLQWYLDSGVIAEVPPNEFNEWCSPGFFVPKPNGKARLVVDYKELNKYVHRPVHPFPSPRDIIRDIKADSKWFMKLDALQGYYQVPLDEESSRLTTFLLPSGRYRFLRAPMGLNSSSDGFCFRTDYVFRPVDGVLKIVDDALLQAPTKEQLLDSFRQVLLCCRENNLTLSREKVQMGEEISFAGYIIGANGIKADPAKLAGIQNFPAPTNISELRGFLGLVNQLGHFVPDLAHMCKPLRELLKKNVAWQWTIIQETAFKEVKELLLSSAVVAAFDPMRPTQLLTDASRLKGLGYALMQQGNDGNFRLVQCGSRSLSSAETRYATNELECLAIQWAICECRHYLLGAKFAVVTDHRPLVGTFQKPLSDLNNARLLRYREKLLDYDFTVSWSPGKTHLIADALSRAPVFDPPEDKVDAVSNLVLGATSTDPILKDIVKKANTDSDYCAVKAAIVEDKLLKNLPPLHPAKQFKQVWEKLSVSKDGLILYDADKIVIPRPCQSRILDIIHTSHAGIAKSREFARQRFYWPRMGEMIKDKIERCEECILYRYSKPTEELQMHEEATKPMESVSVDLFECKGKDYIVMCDRYSIFTWVFRLRRTDTEAIIKALCTAFLEYGFPKAIMSDNGPQFRQDFKEFCENNNILHVTSSPYNHPSNGLAEQAVKSMKNLLRKSSSWDNFLVRLLHWRNVPTAGYKTSPAERFFNRRQRSVLLPELAAISPPKQRAAEKELSEKEKRKTFSVGDKVIIQNAITKRWERSGVILDSTDSGRSYILELPNGRTLVRNRRYLRLSKEDDRTIESAPLASKTNLRLKNKTEPDKSASSDEGVEEQKGVRRSSRSRRAPARYSVY